MAVVALDQVLSKQPYSSGIVDETSLSSLSDVLSVVFLVLAFLTRVRQDLKVDLISLSLIVDNVFKLFLLHFFLMYKGVLPACISVGSMCVCAMLMEARRGH